MTEDVQPVRTGVDRVDEVIEAVEQLEERPLEEHVGVFETAHEQLRRALDASHDGPDGPGQPDGSAAATAGDAVREGSHHDAGDDAGAGA